MGSVKPQAPTFRRRVKARSAKPRFQAKYIEFVCDKIARTDVYLTAFSIASDLIWKYSLAT